MNKILLYLVLTLFCACKTTLSEQATRDLIGSDTVTRAQLPKPTTATQSSAGAAAETSPSKVAPTPVKATMNLGYPTSTGGQVSISSTFDIPLTNIQRLQGIAADAIYLYLLVYETNRPYNRLKLIRGKLNGQFTEVGSFLDDGHLQYEYGFAWDGTRSWIRDNRDYTKFRRFNSAFVETTPATLSAGCGSSAEFSGSGCWGQGLTFSGGYIFWNNTPGYLRKFNSTNGLLVWSLADQSMGFHKLGLNSPDKIKIAAAGNTLWIVTQFSYGPTLWKADTLAGIVSGLASISSSSDISSMDTLEAKLGRSFIATQTGGEVIFAHQEDSIVKIVVLDASKF